MVFRDLARGLLGRLVSLGVFALGFWVLYQALLRDDNILLLGSGIILGSVFILGSLYLMATTRRLGAQQESARAQETAEEEPGDSLNGSGKGN